MAHVADHLSVSALEQRYDLLDNVAKFSIGFVHTIAREALRRCPRADPMLKDASRSGRARPVQDGVHHGQAIQGTPTLQP
jgi:hypothetical protein